MDAEGSIEDKQSNLEVLKAKFQNNKGNIIDEIKQLNQEINDIKKETLVIWKEKLEETKIFSINKKSYTCY